MTRLFRFACLSLTTVALCAGPLAARAQTVAPDTPAPASASDAGGDAICTDRPTKVFSTCTAPQGHLQLETDLFNGTFQRQGGVTTDTYYATNPTLKYGLTDKLDLEVNIAPYEIVRTHDKFGDDSTIGGVGDLYLRAKYAAYSTKDGKFTFAVIPYVKAPIARAGIGNGEVEGGSAFAASYKLTDKWTVSISPEVDAYADDAGSGHHLNHIEVLNFGYSLPANVTVSGELWGDWNYDPSGTVKQYSADVAVAWQMRKDLQLDGGLNFGLNHETPGVQAYVGVSQRF